MVVPFFHIFEVNHKFTGVRVFKLYRFYIQLVLLALGIVDIAEFKGGFNGARVLRVSKYEEQFTSSFLCKTRIPHSVLIRGYIAILVLHMNLYLRVFAIFHNLSINIHSYGDSFLIISEPIGSAFYPHLF